MLLNSNSDFAPRKNKLHNLQMFQESQIDTPLGPLLAIANNQALYLLQFADKKGLEKEIALLKLVPGKPNPIIQIENELNEYFCGKNQEFKTPLFLLDSSPFQQKVWRELQCIPYGETRSYSDIARAIKKPSAHRAVARANAANRFIIAIPCHRVINHNGNLGGYSGDPKRKQWLLKHEKAEQSLFIKKII